MYGEAYDRAFGKHSNIPDCCIEFFVAKWLPMEIEARDNYSANIRKAAEQFGWFDPNCWDREVLGCWLYWNYVPCPDCIISGHKQELHVCTRKCRMFKLKIKRL